MTSLSWAGRSLSKRPVNSIIAWFRWFCQAENCTKIDDGTPAILCIITPCNGIGKGVYGANSIRVVWFKELVRNTHKADYIYRTYKALMNEK